MRNTFEARIVVERFHDMWYPKGSDTPIPDAAVVEVYTDMEKELSP